MEKLQDKINKNNREALDLNNSIWVAASAGSGKTTILVKRLTRLLLEDVDISKIVCITYTKTGATEMKSRIYDGLSKWVLMNDEKLKGELNRLIGNSTIDDKQLLRARTLFARIIDNIDNLKILTIHSFCQQIIKKFPLEAGVLPNFEVMDEYTSNNLIKDALEDVLQNIEQNPQLKVKLDIIVEEKSEDDFYSIIYQILNKRSMLEKIKNLDYEEEIYNYVSLHKNCTKQILVEEFSDNFPHVIRDIADLMQDSKEEKKQIIDYNLSNLEERIEKWKEYILIFLTKKYEQRARPPLKLEGHLEKKWQEEQNRCLDLVNNIFALKTAEMSSAVLTIALLVLEKYQEIKDTRGLLDYDDLIGYALNLLTNTEYSAWINYKLDSGLEHILLDEAQDTSSAQWELLQALTGDFFSGMGTHENSRTLFVVGDEKQSIFKFQGANPEMFDEKYNFFKELITSSNNEFRRINLQYSFRTVPLILKFVDQVFASADNSSRISKLEEKIEHNSIRSSCHGRIELWPIAKAPKVEKQEWAVEFDNEEEVKNQELLAKNIVKKIIELTTSGITIETKKGIRPIQYGDILLLVRNRNSEFLSYLIRYLQKNNIPNSGYDKLSLFDNIAIMDFMAILNFTQFTDDDLNLANLIKSPILSLTEDDLLAISRRAIELKTNLWEVISSLDEYKDTFELLNEFKELSKSKSIYELTLWLLEDKNIRKKYIDRFGGNINDVLNEFLYFVKSFEENNFSSILLFLETIKKTKVELKKDLDHSINQVRIMTVHASKGLEAPIVFIADGYRNFNSKEDKFVYDENDTELNIPLLKSRSIVLKAREKTIEDKSYNEYLRLFYVATTRAENQLYICNWATNGSSTNRDTSKDGAKNWYDLAKQALESMPNVVKSKFSYDEDETVLILTDEVETQESTAKIETRPPIIKEKPSYLQSYSATDTVKKVINPSQFYRHDDRDNLLSNVNEAILKGNAVHKLLEILPNIAVNEREAVADLYLQNQFYLLSPEDMEKIKNQSIELLNHRDFQQFFTPSSKAEVELVGEVDGALISGKLDRIVLAEDKILLLDYKNTSKDYSSKEELPIGYIKQLELYKKLLENLYPNKAVEGYILTTSHLKLIRIF